MSAAFAVRATRQSLIFSAIVGLHVGVLILMAIGTKLPPFPVWVPKPILVTTKPPPPKPVLRPVSPGPVDIEPYAVPEPPLEVPRFPRTAPDPDAVRPPAGAPAGEGPDVPVARVQVARLRTRDARLAALVDACYPSASRRLGEEGKTIVRVVVGADGRASGRSVVQSSEFPRLDGAVDCVLRRLEFEPGRRDGRAMDAEVLLPIVFRLN